MADEEIDIDFRYVRGQHETGPFTTGPYTSGVQIFFETEVNP